MVRRLANWAVGFFELPSFVLRLTTTMHTQLESFFWFWSLDLWVETLANRYVPKSSFGLLPFRGHVQIAWWSNDRGVESAQIVASVLRYIRDWIQCLIRELDLPVIRPNRDCASSMAA